MFGVRGSVGFLADASQHLLQNVPFRCQRIQGLRVGNTEIPDNKRIGVALQRIYGIGRKRAHQLLADLSIVNKLTRELTGLEVNSLREEVSKYMIGEELKRCTDRDLKTLTDIHCYRGYRHIDMLPCRGQRTHTNGRTRKEHSKRPNRGW